MASDPRDRAPRFVSLIIQGLIVYSIITVALETMPELSAYRTFFRSNRSRKSIRLRKIDSGLLRCAIILMARSG